MIYPGSIRLNLVTILWVAVALVLGGCESTPPPAAPSDSQRVAASEDDLFSNPFDDRGQIHNEALDYALARLADAERTFTLAEVKEFMEEAIRSYDRMVIEETEPRHEFEVVKIPSAEVHEESLFSETVPDSLLEQVDVETLWYLDQISGILDGTRSAYEIDNDLKQLEEEAYNALHPEGAEIVLSSSAVARYSSLYWESHSAEWSEIVGAVLDDDDNDVPLAVPGAPKYDYWATAVCLISVNGSKHCFPAGAVKSMEIGVDNSQTY